MNSDGDQLRSIFSKIDKLKLSRDASEILNISLLTNAYQPGKNMTEKELAELKKQEIVRKLADLKTMILRERKEFNKSEEHKAQE